MMGLSSRFDMKNMPSAFFFSKGQQGETNVEAKRNVIV